MPRSAAAGAELLPQERQSILRRLLDGALPVCCTCKRALEQGEAKVGVRLHAGSSMTFWRCGDCEYRVTRR
jgi:hypothetical protein